MDAIDVLGELVKGEARGGRYFRRVATGNPKRPWRYYYTREQYVAAHGEGAHLHGGDAKEEKRAPYVSKEEALAAFKQHGEVHAGLKIYGKRGNQSIHPRHLHDLERAGHGQLTTPNGEYSLIQREPGRDAPGTAWPKHPNDKYGGADKGDREYARKKQAGRAASHGGDALGSFAEGGVRQRDAATKKYEEKKANHAAVTARVEGAVRSFSDPFSTFSSSTHKSPSYDTVHITENHRGTGSKIPAGQVTVFTSGRMHYHADPTGAAIPPSLLQHLQANEAKGSDATPGPNAANESEKSMDAIDTLGELFSKAKKKGRRSGKTPTSEAQRRWAFAAEARGDLPEGDALKWSRKVKGEHLPEHAAKSEDGHAHRGLYLGAEYARDAAVRQMGQLRAEPAYVRLEADDDPFELLGKSLVARARSNSFGEGGGLSTVASDCLYHGRDAAVLTGEAGAASGARCTCGE
jgi:hypothetical protein